MVWQALRQSVYQLPFTQYLRSLMGDSAGQMAAYIETMVRATSSRMSAHLTILILPLPRPLALVRRRWATSQRAAPADSSSCRPIADTSSRPSPALSRRCSCACSPSTTSTCARRRARSSAASTAATRSRCMGKRCVLEHASRRLRTLGARPHAARSAHRPLAFLTWQVCFVAMESLFH